MEDKEGHSISQAPLSLTEPDINWKLDDGLINAVITAAVWSVGQRPGVWSKMMTALDKGGRKTKEGKKLYFVMNFGEQERTLPACFAGQRDLLTGEKAADTLKKYEVCIIEAEES